MNTMSLPDWKGYFAAMVTPFNRDLTIDHAGICTLVDWLINEGVNGIVLAGTTGEWNALTFSERCALFETGRNCAPSSTPLIAGCSALRVEETLLYMKIAASLEIDGVLLTVPPYVCPTERETIEFYRTVASQSRLPIIAYNWPQGTGVDFSVSLAEELVTIDGVVALKSSTSNRILFDETLKAVGNDLLVFGVMPGERGLDTLLTLGGAGCIGATGVLGYKQPGFFASVWNGDLDRARLLGSYDEQLMSILFDGFKGRFGHAIATFKYLLTMQGLPAGPARPPLMALSDESRCEIAKRVKEAGLFERV